MAIITSSAWVSATSSSMRAFTESGVPMICAERMLSTAAASAGVKR